MPMFTEINASTGGELPIAQLITDAIAIAVPIHNDNSNDRPSTQ